MKEGWEYKELGEITTSINGLWKGKKDPFVRVGVIRNANFTKDITLDFSKIEYLDVEEKQYKNRKLQKGDLIVEKSGGSEKQPVGRTVLFNSEGEFSVSNFTSILRINNQNEITPEFLYKYLLYIYKEGKTKEMQKATTGIHNIIYDKFLAILIPILSLAEQQQIVSFLDSEFEKIDALKANAEKQLQAAKDLFQAALKELLTPKEGWVEKELKTICQVINGRAYKQDEMLQVGKYRLLRVGNFFTNDKWYYSDLELEDDKYCCNGDLLYAWSASFGPRIWNGEKVIYHYHIWKLICSDCIDKHYLFYWLDSDIFKTQVMRDLHGATMNHITKSIMETTIVWFPCIDTQKIIVARLDALSANVKALQTNYTETITLCNDLKQSLLKRVFEEGAK